jgi:hypothetical protein
MNRYEHKENLASSLVDSIDSNEWGFQPAIEIIAREHLYTLILDNWPKSQKKTYNDDSYDAELSTAVIACFKSNMREYKR